jgi:ribosomal protein S25
MADVVAEVRAQLEKRLRKLEPLVDEHVRIKDAMDKLAGAIGPPRRRRPQATAAASGRDRSAAAGRDRSAAAGRARPRPRGGRAQQAVKLVQQQPGITTSELAKRMKLKSPSYLYRVLAQLEKDGKVKKEGKGYHPV